VNIHLLCAVSTNSIPHYPGEPYHLERVQLLLDLLRQKRSQPITSGNLTTAVVFAARPSVMEGDTRAKADVVFGSRARRSGCTVGVCISPVRRRKGVFLVQGPFAARPLVFGQAGDFREESRSDHRGGRSGVCNHLSQQTFMHARADRTYA
jgi:hypothetical protein